MCIAWHSHRLHNIAAFSVNRMSGRTANHPRPASPLPAASSSCSFRPFPDSGAVVRPWQRRSAANVNREFIPSGAARRGEARPAEKENRFVARERASELASFRVWVY